MPEMIKSAGTRQGESGNVLFLILIAVALFAALSYAVTQSTRGGGDASREADLINSAQITQYPAGVRTGVVRMIIDGVDVTSLEFNPPSGYGALTANRFGVFHPDGGGATYVTAPAELMENGAAGTWHFNGEFEIVDVGTSTATDEAGNEIMALLPGISDALCAKINEELGISGDVTTAATAATEYATDMEDGYTIPNTDFELGDADTLGLKGQPFGCFIDSGGANVYYHVLLER
jgi:hypothetical protein